MKIMIETCRPNDGVSGEVFGVADPEGDGYFYDDLQKKEDVGKRYVRRDSNGYPYVDQGDRNVVLATFGAGECPISLPAPVASK